MCCQISLTSLEFSKALTTVALAPSKRCACNGRKLENIMKQFSFFWRGLYLIIFFLLEYTSVGHVARRDSDVPELSHGVR